MANGVNKIPLVHEPGALNNMANAATFGKLVADKHFPVSVLPVAGGFNNNYSLATGGNGTLETIGTLDLTTKENTTLYIIDCFYAIDNSLVPATFLYGKKGSHLAWLTNPLGQIVGELKAGISVIIDNNFIKNITIENDSLNSELVMVLTEIETF